MRKTIPTETFYHLINHGPCVLITSGNQKENNVATIAWLTPVNDDPPILAICISEDSYTSELIQKKREFVVNLMSGRFINTLKICGTTSGRRENKFKKANLTPVIAKNVKVPFIKESIGHIECKLKEVHKYNGVLMFIGDVVNVEIESDYYDNYLITEKVQTPHHIGGNFFTLSGKRIKI